MFTGLVVERGRVVVAREREQAEGLRLEIELGSGLAARLEIGSSLSVDGCCLTVVESRACQRTELSDPDSDRRVVVVLELSPETLNRTTLGELSSGDHVNLEPALAMGDALGGHWVQGHVDTTTELVERTDAEDFSTFWWRVPVGLETSFVEKGSVTVDGVSLTVAALKNSCFSAALIPHTLSLTTLGGKQAGARFNIEVDVLAKYVDRVVSARFDALEQRLLATLSSVREGV